MEEFEESVLQIINGCLEFLITVIFVDIPLLRLFWCFSKLGFGAGEKRNGGGVIALGTSITSLFPSHNIILEKTMSIDSYGYISYSYTILVSAWSSTTDVIMKSLPQYSI